MISPEPEYDIGDFVYMKPDYLPDDMKDSKIAYEIIKISHLDMERSYRMKGLPWTYLGHMIAGRQICEVKEMKVVLGKFFGDYLSGIWVNGSQRITPAKLEAMDERRQINWLEDYDKGCLMPAGWVYQEETEQNQLISSGGVGSLHVGARVVVRGDLRQALYGKVNAVGEMVSYRNLTATITSISGRAMDQFKIDLDDGRWNWSAQMFVGFENQISSSVPDFSEELEPFEEEEDFSYELEPRE